MLYQKWTRYHRANCLWQEMLKWLGGTIIKEQKQTKRKKMKGRKGSL